MLLVKFDLDGLDGCKNAHDAYKAMGVGTSEDDIDLKFNNKEVFGNKASYSNMFLNPDTYNKIRNSLDETDRLIWDNYAPLCSGDRYDKIKEAIGELNESVLYIVTPEDSLYDNMQDIVAGAE